MRTLCALVSLLATLQAGMAFDFTVDCMDRIGPVSSLNGVNAGPAHIKGRPVDLSMQYRAMGVNLVRTHDYYGLIDLSNIFPHGFGADPMDPGNYDFDGADSVIESIENAGCGVMFRLGESWYQPPHNAIPSNADTFVEVCMRIMDHYGCAQATPSQSRIRLWEFYNEPQIDRFWDRRADPGLSRFHKLYAATAAAAGQRYPHVLFGGPGSAGADDAGIEAYCRDFCAAISRDPRRPPLDFYSWHSYNRNLEGPYVFARQARKVRAVLNEAGFGKTLNVLDEYNVCSMRVGGDNPSADDLSWRAAMSNVDGAAFLTAALIYLHQYSDVRYACRYRGDIHGGDGGYGLCRDDGSIKRPGWALRAYSGLFPRRESADGSYEYDNVSMVATSGGDTGKDGAADRCRAVMATINEQASCISVLIALWRENSEGFTLGFDRLPAGWSNPTVEHYLVSAVDHFRLDHKAGFAQQYEPKGSFSLACKPVQDTSSSVHIVRIYDAARFDSELATVPPMLLRPRPDGRPIRPPTGRQGPR